MGYINTIRDLEAATYGLPAFGGNSVLKQAGGVQGLHTAHETVLPELAILLECITNYSDRKFGLC